jgi:hypothetical protein
MEEVTIAGLILAWVVAVEVTEPGHVVVVVGVGNVRVGDEESV